MHGGNVFTRKRPFQCRSHSAGLTASLESGGGGPPLILLHGLAGSSRWWYRNVQQLATAFQVYTPDLLGFCRPRPTRMFDLNRAADALVQWMDQLGIKQAHLVGHSMGGYIAIDMAARFPSYVDRLVLVSAAARSAATDHQPTPATMQRFQLRWLNTLPLVMADLWYWRPGDILAAVRTMLETNVQEQLRTITAPSMVLWGEHDPMVPIAQGYELARHLPCEELVVIEAAGHHPMWEQPELFNRELVDFLYRPIQQLRRAQPHNVQAA